MTEDHSPPPGASTEALRALDAASAYGFDPAAAYQAVLAHLSGMEGEQLREVTAALATLATSFARLEWEAWRLRAKVDLDAWTTYTRCRVANGEWP